MKKFNHFKNLKENTEGYLIISITKSELWSINTENAVSIIKFLASSKFSFIKNHNNVQLHFEGVEQSLTSLIEIPQVSQFLQKLVNQCPYFLHFCRPGGGYQSVLGLINRQACNHIQGKHYAIYFYVKIELVSSMISSCLDLNARYDCYCEDDYLKMLNHNLKKYFPGTILKDFDSRATF